MICTTLWKLFLLGKVCFCHMQWLIMTYLKSSLTFIVNISNFLTVECQRQTSLSIFADLRVHAQLKAQFAQWRAALHLQQEARNFQRISQVYPFKSYCKSVSQDISLHFSWSVSTIVDLGILYMKYCAVTFISLCAYSFTTRRFSENASAIGVSTAASRKMHLLCVIRHCSWHCGSSGLSHC